MPDGWEPTSALPREAVMRKKEEFQRPSSTPFAECGICLGVSHMPLAQVTHMLEEEARLLRVHP